MEVSPSYADTQNWDPVRMPPVVDRSRALAIGLRPNDQVERRAEATPAQNENMNRHVRSNAGLGRCLFECTQNCIDAGLVPRTL